MNELPNYIKCGSEYTYEDGMMYVCPECAHEMKLKPQFVKKV